ncbi:MAG: hypothetical protein ACRCS8_00825 [Brevinema sp.]
MNLKHYLMAFLVTMITGTTFAQTVSLQYSRISSGEMRFDVFYEGPSAEIVIPARGRMLNFTNQEGTQFRNNSVTVGSKDESGSYSVKFSYSFIIPNSSGFGSLSTDWYPTIRPLQEGGDAAKYTVASAGKDDLFIYPYIETAGGKFTFVADDKPTLSQIKHTLQVDSSGSVPVSLFNSSTFSSELVNVAKTYDYLKGYFGDLNVNEIIVVNNQLVNQYSFVYNSKLYLLLPRVTSTKHIAAGLAMAWNDEMFDMDNHYLAMLKDAVTRFDVLSFEAPADGTQASGNNYIQNDLGYILPVPTTSYYEELFKKGFTNNSSVDVNAPDMIKYYGLNHLVWAHLGIPEFLAGIKSYFAQLSPKALTPIPVATIPATTPDAPAAATSTETSSTEKGAKTMNWDAMLQNRLQDPLFSLYTKEVLNKNPRYPSLKADGKKISRSSYFVPNVSVADKDGKAHDINWDNFLYANLDISEGSYHLDPERRLPQESSLGSFYTFEKDEQIIRRTVLLAAEKNVNVSERSLRKHMEMIKLPLGAENTFDVTGNKSVYVVVSHILSSQTGLLKDAIKETFISVDHDNNNRTAVIATRFRI